MVNIYFEQSMFLHRIFCLIDAEHLAKVQFQSKYLIRMQILCSWIYQKLNKSHLQSYSQNVIKLIKLHKFMIMLMIKYYLNIEWLRQQFMQPVLSNLDILRTNFGIQELRCNIAYMMKMELIQNFFKDKNVKD